MRRCGTGESTVKPRGGVARETAAASSATLGKDGKSDSSDQQRNRSEAPHRYSLRLLGACDFALSIKSLSSEKIFSIRCKNEERAEWLSDRSLDGCEQDY